MRRVSAGCRARGSRDPNRDHSLFPTGPRPGWCPRLAPFSTPGHAAAQDINRAASSKTTVGTAVPCGPHGRIGRGDRENGKKGCRVLGLAYYPKNRSRKAGIGFVDFVSGGKRACGYRQTAENEAVGVKLPFRAHGKDFLQPREGRLSGAGRGVGVDRVDEDPLSLSVRTASRTDGILVPMRKNSHADEKKFSWA